MSTLTIGAPVTRSSVRNAAQGCEVVRGPRDATFFRRAVVTLTQLEVSNNKLSLFQQGGELRYECDARSFNEDGATSKVYLLRLVTNQDRVPPFYHKLCLKRFHDYELGAWQREHNIIAAMDAAVGMASDRVLAHPLQLQCGGAVWNCVVMEAADTPLSSLEGRLPVGEALKFARAMVTELCNIFEATGLISVDVTLDNFMYVCTVSQYLVMPIDYGGYAFEGSTTAASTYKHPSLAADEVSFLVNQANSAYSLGVCLLMLVQKGMTYDENNSFINGEPAGAAACLTRLAQSDDSEMRRLARIAAELMSFANGRFRHTQPTQNGQVTLQRARSVISRFNL